MVNISPGRRRLERPEPERLSLKHRHKTDRWRADREAAWCGCTRPTKQGLTVLNAGIQAFKMRRARS